MQQSMSPDDIPDDTSADIPGDTSVDISVDISRDVPRSAGRLLDLLEAVLAEGTCNLTSAAARVELTPTTALRHLRALEARGYVQRSAEGVYSSGPTLRRIAAVVHEGGPMDRLIEAAQPHLVELAKATGESCYLAVADRRTATYVATAESSRTIRHVGWVGQTVPLEDTAVGAALAHPGTVMTRSGAVEPDIAAVSLALPALGTIRAALSVIGPTNRMVGAALEQAQGALEQTASALSRDLGINLGIQQPPTEDIAP